MTSEADWRLENLRRFRGATFRRSEYSPPTPQWDHDHCEGCFAKFANFNGPEVLYEGYVHAEPYKETPEPAFITRCKEQGMRPVPAPIVDGCSLHWLCSRCFDDFCGILSFRLES
jgi:hypothetical protein